MNSRGYQNFKQDSLHFGFLVQRNWCFSLEKNNTIQLACDCEFVIHLVNLNSYAYYFTPYSNFEVNFFGAMTNM